MNIADIQVTFLDSMGTDLSVVNAARVSFDKVSEQFEQQDSKLITYLAKHKHTSPFNHAFASFRIKAPIFVARQLVKHKFLPWNETSRRYVETEPEFYVPSMWRKRAVSVKQGSSFDSIKDTTYVEYINNINTEDALASYKKLLARDVCPEQARMVLPQNTMTEWVWSGSLGAFADMCRLRLDSHTQQETQEVAKKVSEEMANLYPMSWKALLEIA